jgi:hypothetical protein
MFSFVAFVPDGQRSKGRRQGAASHRQHGCRALLRHWRGPPVDAGSTRVGQGWQNLRGQTKDMKNRQSML